MEHEYCRLPSSGRPRHAYVKLLCRVDPNAQNGFGFEGAVLRPGAWIDAAALRPTAEYPEIPVALEYTSLATGPRRRAEQLYVLWRWDAVRRQWIELGRDTALAWEWAVTLRPLALRALIQRVSV